MIRRGITHIEVVAGVVALVAMGAALLIPLYSGSAPRPPRPAPLTAIASNPSSKSTALPLADVAYLGQKAGCATANCHGGTRADGKAWKTSAFVVIEQDVHAKAFHVLYEPRSRDMIERLTQNASLDADAYLHELESRCVGCHATPLPAETAALPRDSEAVYQHYSSGVSCEACHGPASQWRSAHLRQDWTTNAANERIESQKADTGFHQLAVPSVAAQTCVRCHVGTLPSPEIGSHHAAEVTHDLIAAGHPRLDFEFAAWYSRLPPHWDQAREQASQFHTESWAAGQAASLDAFAALTQGQRARNLAGEDIPWPELAQRDCFACHHHIAFPSNAAATRARPALPYPDHWRVFGSLDAAQADAFDERLQQFLTAQPTDDQSKAAFQAPPELTHQQLAVALANHPEMSTWDELVGWYYAAEAVARDAERANELRVALNQLRRDIESLLQSDSEEAAPPISRYTSPHWFQPGSHGADEEKSSSVGQRHTNWRKQLNDVKHQLRSLGRAQ